MDYLTTDQVIDWANSQPDDAFFCPHCFSRLVEHEGEKGIVFMCRNEMCLYEEEGKIILED